MQPRDAETAVLFDDELIKNPEKPIGAAKERKEQLEGGKKQSVRTVPRVVLDWKKSRGGEKGKIKLGRGVK